MADEQEKREAETPNETLLRDIREDYTYYRDYWRENHEEAKKDLRFVSGDPWEPEDRRMREDNNRPVLCPDELDQYLNQAINNLRQNKRAIKVNPVGSGATDKDAERRGNLIRGIEYKSNAQSAYTNAFECALSCGIGFFRVTTKVISEDDEVEPRIKEIENPLSVLLDPNAKEADFSDQKRCFVLDILRARDFEQKYPKAKKQSFTPDDLTAAPEWFQGENIIVAEYWRIDGYDEDGEGGTVKQYVTNGLEILEEHEWPGSWIPIIPVIGKKVYVPYGSEMKRFYYSMIRKARGPQMMLAYIASQEAEEYGMMPRAPVIGYVGQFETDKKAWDSANKVPLTRLQVDPIVDGSNGQVLPLPQRSPFSPNASAYEIGFERWRRSVQSAMGITPLPTAAQRQNEKSGVALERIQSQQAIGSFHFTDNFDRSLENAGRQLNELITKVIDTPRQMSSREPDETHSLMHIVPTGMQPVPPQPGEQPAAPEDLFDPQKGDFDVTISTGPSYQSQREEASDFVDLLTQNLANIPPPGSPQAKILSLGIRIKEVGPIGDEISKILDPQQDGQEPLPPQAQAQIQQMQQHAQQAMQVAAQLGQEKQGKVWETQGKLQVLAAQHAADMELEDKKLLAQLTIAEVNTKAQNAADREADRAALEAQFHDQAHDVALNAQQAQQAQQMQQQQAAAQSQQSAQDAQQQQQAQPQGAVAQADGSGQ